MTLDIKDVDRNFSHAFLDDSDYNITVQKEILEIESKL